MRPVQGIKQVIGTITKNYKFSIYPSPSYRPYSTQYCADWKNLSKIDVFHLFVSIISITGSDDSK